MKSDKRFSARRVFGAAVLGAFGALLLVIPGASSGDARSPAARAGGANSALYTEWARAGGGAAGVKFGSFAVSRPAGEAVVGDLAEKFKGILSESVLVDGDDVREYLNARARARVMDAAEERFSDWWSARRAGLDDKLLTAGADYVTEYLTAAAGARAERFRFVRTIEVDFKSGVGERRWQSGLSALGALRETERDALAWQLRGYGAEESAYGANAGLIYRWLPVAAGGSLAGVNVFLDYEQHGDYDESFWRWSLGGEYRNAYIDVYANQYWAITDAVEQGGDIIYTQDGREVQLNLNAGGLFKRLGALSGGLTWYKWDGEFGEDDDEGLRYHLRLSPAMSGLRLELELDSPEGGDLDWGGNISYTHTFGAPPAGVSAAETADFDARAHFFEPVRREYAQRIRRVENVGANNQIAATILAGSADLVITPPSPAGGTPEPTTATLSVGGTVTTTFTRRHTVSVGTAADSELALRASNWTVTVRAATRMRLENESTILTLMTGAVYVRRQSDLVTLSSPGAMVNLLGTELEFSYNGTNTTISLREGLIAMEVTEEERVSIKITVDSRFIAADDTATVPSVRITPVTVASDGERLPDAAAPTLTIGCASPSQRDHHRFYDPTYTGCAGDAYLSGLSNGEAVFLRAPGGGGEITLTMASGALSVSAFLSSWGTDSYPFSPAGATLRTAGDAVALAYTPTAGGTAAEVEVAANSTVVVRTRDGAAAGAAAGIELIVRAGGVSGIGANSVTCPAARGMQTEGSVNVIAACGDAVTFLDADGNAYTTPLNLNSRVGTGRLITVDVAGGDDGGYNFSITPSGGALRLVNASGASLVLTLDASAVLTANFTVRATPINALAAEFVDTGTLTVAVNVASEFALRKPDITPVVATELPRDVPLFTLTLEGNIGPESASAVSLASSDPAGVANLFTVGDINNGRVVVALTSSGPLGSAGEISLVIGATETLGDDFPGNTGGVLNGSYMLTLTVRAAAPGAVAADFAYAGSGANISLASDGTDSAADHAAYSVGETGALVVVSNARNLPVFGVSLSGGDYAAGIAGTPPTGFQIEGLELHLADTPPGPGPYTMTLEVGDGHSTSGSAQFIVTVVLVNALTLNPEGHDRRSAPFNVTVRGLAVGTVTAQSGIPPYSYAIAAVDPLAATPAFSVDGNGVVTYTGINAFRTDQVVIAVVRVTDRLGTTADFGLTMTTTAPLGFAASFSPPARQIVHFLHRNAVFYTPPAGAVVGGQSPYSYAIADETTGANNTDFDINTGTGAISLINSIPASRDGDSVPLRVRVRDSATPPSEVAFTVSVLFVNNAIEFSPASASVAVSVGHTGNITTIARARWTGEEVLGAISYRLTGTAPAPVGVNVANRQVATPSALTAGEYVLTLAADPQSGNIHGIDAAEIIAHAGTIPGAPHFILTVHAVAAVALANDTRQLRFDDADATQEGRVVYDFSDVLTGGSGAYTYRIDSIATMGTDAAAANVGLNTATGELTLTDNVIAGTAPADEAELTLSMVVEVSDNALSSTARGTLMLIWGTGLGLSAPTQARHLATELPHDLDIVTLTAGGARGTDAADTTAAVISVNPNAEAGKFAVRRIADDEYEWAISLNGAIASPLTVTVVVGATEDLTGDENDSSATATLTVIAEHPGAVEADFAYVGSGATLSLDAGGNPHAVYSTGETGALVEASNARNAAAASGMSISGGDYVARIPDSVTGFEVDGLTLKLASTPPAAGAYTVNFAVIDDHATSGDAEFAVSILLVDAVSFVADAYPPDGTALPSFSTEATDLTLATMTLAGGAAPYTFTIFGAAPAAASAAFSVADADANDLLAHLVFSADTGFDEAVAVAVTARVTDALGGTADFELNVTTTAPLRLAPTFSTPAVQTVRFSHREAFFTPTVGSFVDGTPPYETFAVAGADGLDAAHFELEADGGLKLAAAVAAGDAAFGTVTVRVSDSAQPTPGTADYEVPVRIVADGLAFDPPATSIGVVTGAPTGFNVVPAAAWSGTDYGAFTYSWEPPEPSTPFVFNATDSRGDRRLIHFGKSPTGGTGGRFLTDGEKIILTIRATPGADNLHGLGATFEVTVFGVPAFVVTAPTAPVTRRHPGTQAVEDAILYDFSAALSGGNPPYAYTIRAQGADSDDGAADASAKIGADGMVRLASDIVTTNGETVLTLTVDLRASSNIHTGANKDITLTVIFRPAGRLSDTTQPLITVTATAGDAVLDFAPSDPSGTNEPETVTISAAGADVVFSSPPYNLSASVAAGGGALLKGDGYTVTLAAETTVSVLADGATLHLVGGSVGIARDGGGILDDAGTTAGTNLPLSGVSLLISVVARDSSGGFALKQFDASDTEVHSTVINAPNAKGVYSGVHDLSLHARSAATTVVIQTPEWAVTLHGNTTVSLTGRGTRLHIIGGTVDIEDGAGGLNVVQGGTTPIKLSGEEFRARAAVPGALRQQRARRVAADIDMVLSAGMVELTMTTEAAAYFEMDDLNSTIIVVPSYLRAETAPDAGSGLPAVLIYGLDRAAMAATRLTVGCATREQRDNRRFLHGLAGGFASAGKSGFTGCPGDAILSGIPAGQTVLLRQAGEVITLVGKGGVPGGVSAAGRHEIWPAYPFVPAGATLDTTTETLTAPVALTYSGANAPRETPRVVTVTMTSYRGADQGHGYESGYRWQDNRFFRYFVGYSPSTVTTTLTIAGDGEYGAAALVAGGSTVAFSLPAGVTAARAATHITAALLAGEMLNVEGAAEASCITGADPQAGAPEGGALRVYAACAGGVRFADAPYGTVTIHVPGGGTIPAAQATLVLGGGGGHYNFEITPLGAPADDVDVTAESGGVLVLTVDTTRTAAAALYRVVAGVPGGAVNGYTVPAGTITVEINIGERGVILDESGGRLSGAPEVPVLPTRLLRERALFTLAFPPSQNGGGFFRLSIAGARQTLDPSWLGETRRDVETPFGAPYYAAPGLPAVVSVSGRLPAAAGLITVSVAYREVAPQDLNEENGIVTISVAGQSPSYITLTLFAPDPDFHTLTSPVPVPAPAPEPVSGVFEFVLTTEHPGAVAAEFEDYAVMSVGAGGNIPVFSLSEREDALARVVNTRNLPAASGADLSGAHDGYGYSYAFIDGEGGLVNTPIVDESGQTIRTALPGSYCVRMSEACLNLFRITRQGRVFLDFPRQYRGSANLMAAAAGLHTVTIRVADAHADTANRNFVITASVAPPPALAQHSPAAVVAFTDAAMPYLATVTSSGGVADGAGTYDIAGVFPAAAAGVFEMRAPQAGAPANTRALYFAGNPDGIAGSVVVTVRITDAIGGEALLMLTVNLNAPTGETFTRNFDVPGDLYVAAGYTGPVFAPDGGAGAPVSGGTPPYGYALSPAESTNALHTEIAGALELDARTGTLYVTAAVNTETAADAPMVATLAVTDTATPAAADSSEISVHIVAANYRVIRETVDGATGYSVVNLPLFDSSAAGGLLTVSANLRPANDLNTTLLAGDALEYSITGVYLLSRERNQFGFPTTLRASSGVDLPPQFALDGSTLSLTESLDTPEWDRGRSRWVVTIAAVPSADFAHGGAAFAGFDAAPGLVEVTLDYIPPLARIDRLIEQQYANGYAPCSNVQRVLIPGDDLASLAGISGGSGDGIRLSIVSQSRAAGATADSLRLNSARTDLEQVPGTGGPGCPETPSSVPGVTITAVLAITDVTYPEELGAVMVTVEIGLDNGNYTPPTPPPAPAPDHLLVIGAHGIDDMWYSAGNGAHGADDWRQLPDPPFGTRNNHMAAVLDGTIFVAGGQRSGTTEGHVAADVWASTDGARWRKIGGNRGRLFVDNLDDAQMVVHNGSLIISGGRGGGIFRRYQSKVWASADGETWTNLIRETDESMRFGGRSGHAMVSHGDTLFVIGGRLSGSGNGVDEVWSSSDGAAWTQIGTAGARFGRLIQLAAVSFGANMYVSGGRSVGGIPGNNDVWSSSDGVAWTRVSDNLGANVYGHAMVSLGASMYIIGGPGNDKIFASADGADWSEVSGDNPFLNQNGVAAVAFNPAGARPLPAELPDALDLVVPALAGATIAQLAEDAVADTPFQYALLGTDPTNIGDFVSVNAGGDLVLSQNIDSTTGVPPQVSLMVEVRYGIGAALTVHEIVLNLRARVESGPGRIFIFGGNRAAYTTSASVAVTAGNAADVWVASDLAGGRWEERARAAAFGARQNHMAATLGGSVFVAGGSETGDIWATQDGTNWGRVTNNVPFLRGLHRAQMVAHNGSLYVTGDRVGGRAGVGGSIVCDGALVTVTLDPPVCETKHVVRYINSSGVATLTMTLDVDVVITAVADAVRADVTEEQVCTNERVTPTCRYVDDGGARKGEVWASADGRAWTLVNENAPAHRKFDARSNHAMVSHGGTLYVIGGNDGGGGIDNNRLNDVWASTDGAMWTLVNNPDAAGMFPERYEHAAAVFSGRIYIVGGVTGSREVAGDVWSSADGRRWRRESADAFGGRGHLGHVLLPIGDKIYIVGGAGSSTASGRGDSPELWSSENGKVWTRVDGGRKAGEPPFPAYRRINHAAVVLP